jgi:hypothetical protein
MSLFQKLTPVVVTSKNRLAALDARIAEATAAHNAALEAANRALQES